MDTELEQLATKVGKALKANGCMLAVAESCTGGWASAAITAVPGSSHWFDRGFITYTNESKQELLGVSAATLETHGAVSEETAREMVLGALKHSHARMALAVSGIAGPTGGRPDKPVGTVCLAWSRKDGLTVSQTDHFEGDRDAIRRQAVIKALNGVLELVQPGSSTPTR